MDCPRKLKKALCLALLLLVLCPTTFATQSGTDADAHKIVIALDASKSMTVEFTKNGQRVPPTDPKPDELRFKAIRQFLASLPERGYYLGWVVFSTTIDYFEPVQEIRSQADKDAFLTRMESASEKADGQYTNIPAALEKSVELLLEGKNAPSSAEGSVLFLSDGNTDPIPPSSKTKDEALKKARDSGIRIFSMCLNVSGAAEPDELADITNRGADGGLFEEITSMDKLKEVLLGDFYEKMASKRSFKIPNVKADESGYASQAFTVPGFGVKDVTIDIAGHVSELWLTDSENNKYPQEPQDEEWAVAHLPNGAKPGKWILHIYGDKNAEFTVKFSYDDKLKVSLSVQPTTLFAGDNAEILLTFSDETETASKPEQYKEGFEVSLTAKDENGVPLTNVPDMAVASDGRGYVSNYAFSQAGEYALSASVTMSVVDTEPPLEFQSNEGRDLPVTVSLPPNSPPQLTRSAESSDSVWRFPWSSSYERQVANLAEDREDKESELRYELVSPENAQFDSETRALRIERLWTGGPFAFSQETAIVFNVTDSQGLPCQATLTVTTRNLLMPFLIAFALVAFAAVAFLIYGALNPPYFHGEISVSSEINGRLRTAPPIEPSSASKGKFPLSRFQVDNIGLDYTKCFFIAQRVRKGRRPYIILKTNRKVTTRKKKKCKKVELTDGIEQRLYLGDDLTKQLRVKYAAKAPQGPRGKRR